MRSIFLLVTVIAAVSADYDCEKHLQTGKKKALVKFFDSRNDRSSLSIFQDEIWKNLTEYFSDYQHMAFVEIDCYQCPSKCYNFKDEKLPSLSMVYNNIVMSACVRPEKYVKAENYVYEYMPKKYKALKNFTIAMSHCDILYPELKGTEIFSNDLNEKVRKGLSYVLFYDGLCHYCKMFYPVWARMIEMYAGRNINFYRVDCLSVKPFCAEKKAVGFPTLFMYVDGEQAEEYLGSDNFQEIQEFTEKYIKLYQKRLPSWNSYRT